MDKKKILITIGGIVVLALVAAAFILETDDQKTLNVSEEDGITKLNQDQLQQIIDKNQAGVLSDTEKRNIRFIIEEEKMARDLYFEFSKKYDKQIFENIYKAEQTHMKSMQKLVNKYGMEDPTAKTDVGEFQNRQIQKMYDELLEQGNKSLVEALKVGAEVEDRDIDDIQDNMTNTSKADILFVYENLKRASKNHLRAFMKNIEKENGEYSPKYLEQAEFNSIVGSGIERGRWWE